MALTDVSGDGELASSLTQARLTVLHNDDPINLRDSVLEASEGDEIELVVMRGGHANGECAYTQVHILPFLTMILFLHRCCRSIIPSNIHICFS